MSKRTFLEIGVQNKKMDNFNPFSGLKWYRLKVKLANTRLSSKITAHPFSIIQAIIKGTSQASEIESKTEPIIFFHLKDKKHTLKLHQFEEIPVEIFFCGCDLGDAEIWRELLKIYLSDPILTTNFEIIQMGKIEERDYGMIEKELGKINSEGEICLEFLSHFPFKPEKGKPRTYISKETFIKSLERRFSHLFGKEIVYKTKKQKDNFSILPYYWNYTEIRHLSKSQPGKIQYINGCTGKLYLKGNFNDFLPFLLLGSELHIGSKISNSQGYYRILKESPGYFETQFPNKKILLFVIREVLENYDEAIGTFLKEEGFSFNEECYAEKLANQIAENFYSPSPTKAFLINKADGSQRLIERPSFSDLIIQRYLAKILLGVFDNIFEEGSIGFRKGVSREKAVEIIQSAISEGYRYVIESDIGDFFPSIDLDILTKLLDFYLPKDDKKLKNILFKFIKNGYILDGNFYPRLKGLAQGSPLSPLLANLYLDSFDEKIKKLGAKIIRYADDFLILTRSKEEAEEMFRKAKDLLSHLYLKIKEEKTAIKPIKEGFQFLGIKFEEGEAKVEPEEVFKGFKKPLYITEPYLFLSINGEAIEIKKQGIVIEAIPLRRINEIMVMGKAAFSTTLFKKCVQNNIPLTITLDNGYYITIVKPDSKRYYEISAKHSQKHHSLSETEILAIAKEIAIAKLKNYISLFRQRYVKKGYLFIRQLENFIQSIQQAGDISQVRGLEGIATRKTYQEINKFIENPFFHFKKRRKFRADRFNSLINFGHYLLFSYVNATIRAMGLNPYLGFLHSPADNYESLVADIADIFKPRIAFFLIRLINLKIITPDDFLETERGYYLKRESAKKFINHFEAEMNKKISKNEPSVKENIYVQIAIIKKWVLENGSLSFYN